MPSSQLSLSLTFVYASKITRGLSTPTNSNWHFTIGMDLLNFEPAGLAQMRVCFSSNFCTHPSSSLSIPSMKSIMLLRVNLKSVSRSLISWGGISRSRSRSESESEESCLAVLKDQNSDPSWPWLVKEILFSTMSCTDWNSRLSWETLKLWKETGMSLHCRTGVQKLRPEGLSVPCTLFSLSRICNCIFNKPPILFFWKNSFLMS
mmetsp:Transcript_14378/g.10388  ORF Transcript_14378/g.10388 Transcript_14378/m.10388 type:complete len:205 (+) Transcript_14378:181-795(+)